MTSKLTQPLKLVVSNPVTQEQSQKKTETVLALIAVEDQSLDQTNTESIDLKRKSRQLLITSYKLSLFFVFILALSLFFTIFMTKDVPVFDVIVRLLCIYINIGNLFSLKNVLNNNYFEPKYILFWPQIAFNRIKNKNAN